MPAITRKLSHIIYGLIFLSCCTNAMQQTTATLTPTNYVSSSTCAECHQSQYQLWQQSHHHASMLPADKHSVVGDFNNTTFNDHGKNYLFFKTDDLYKIAIWGPQLPRKEYWVSYTFGIHPLQQYLINFHDGRKQAFPIAWDNRSKNKGGQKWFNLQTYATKKGDTLHWLGNYYNWNSQCADCHSTNLQKNYQTKTNSYQSTWSEINVGCEACHGPGREHVEWAKSVTPDTNTKPPINKKLSTDLKPLGQWILGQKLIADNSTEKLPYFSDQHNSCARCHSRRSVIDDHNRTPFIDNHYLQMISEPHYYSDGQINDEVYVMGSFLQSAMFMRGVECSNCHEPHSTQLRLPGNAVCSQCHRADYFDSPKHHFHPLISKASTARNSNKQLATNTQLPQCVDCHMPETTYMKIDPRRDHSIRIPSPSLSKATGSPNACSNCHQQSNDWLDSSITQWKNHKQNQNTGNHVGQSKKRMSLQHRKFFQAMTAHDIETIDMLLTDTEYPSILSASALLNFQGNQLQVTTIASKYLSSIDPLKRISAIRLTKHLSLDERVILLLSLVDDSLSSVRLAIANALLGIQLNKQPLPQRIKLKALFEEYLQYLQYHLDSESGLIRLAEYWTKNNNYQQAEVVFRQLLKFEPKTVTGRLNFADLHRLTKNDTQGIKIILDAVSIAPKYAPSHYALGLNYIRQKKYQQALLPLAKARQLQPDNIQYTLVLALAYNKQQQQQLALNVLLPLHKKHSTNINILQLIIATYHQLDDRKNVALYTKKLSNLKTQF